MYFAKPKILIYNDMDFYIVLSFHDNKKPCK